MKYKHSIRNLLSNLVSITMWLPVFETKLKKSATRAYDKNFVYSNLNLYC